MLPAIVTIPNASVPVGKTHVRKTPIKERELSTDAVLRAAGVMIVTPDDKALFLKRASGHDHAGEWCFPGGAIENGETAELAAIRETREETGHIIDDAIKEIDNEVSPEGVDFTTFVLRANNPFIPELDDEHVGWAWSPIDDPPEPLHPGVASTLERIIEFGQDEKSSKETANYLNGPVSREPCRHCTMFIQPDSCTAVQGEISPTGHCDYFKQSRIVGDIKAANVATPAELRSVIKFPPPKAASAVRAINIAFANSGSVGTELQQSTKARRFEQRGGLTEHDKGPGPLGHDNEFKESEHPRAPDGKFGSGGSKSKPSAKESHEQTKVVDGKRISASGHSLPAHIASMRIPPAWTDVTYSNDPKAALQVTGKDAKGRSQAIYSADFIKGQAAAKFARIKELNAKYDRVSAQNAKAQQSNDPKIKDSADCLALIMKTGIRPGSTAETGGAVKAYGATTLEGKHVVEEDGKVFLCFTGKKGVALNIPIMDEALAKDIIKRAKKAGSGGKLFPATSHALLLAHTHTLDGGGFKTKDFRTHIGTQTAFKLVNDHPAPKNEKEYKKAVKEVAKRVSSILGNTPTVALQSYINPTVFAQWRAAI